MESPGHPHQPAGIPPGAQIGYIYTRQFLKWLRDGRVPLPGAQLNSEAGRWHLDQPGEDRIYLVVTDNADIGRPLPSLVPPQRYLDVREAKRLDPTIGMARLR